MAELASTNIYGHLTVFGDVRVSSIIGKADVISIPTTVLMEHADFGQQLIVKRNGANLAAAITYENSSGILGRAGFSGTGTYAIYYGTSTTAAWEIDASGVLQKGTIPWSRLSNVPSYASRWPSWSEVTSKPSTFTPSSHTHAAGDITSGTIAATRLPSASTSAAGIVQLSSATNSTSTTLAATASAVKAAYDLAASKWTYNEDTIKGVKVNNATTADVLDPKDTRDTNHLPGDRGKGVYADFKRNSTSGLSDGGSYHGILTFRPYGSPTDFSGGYPHQLAFTENENIWYRKGTSASNWSSWKKIWHAGNDGSGSGLDADTVDGKHASAFAEHVVLTTTLDTSWQGSKAPYTKTQTVNGILATDTPIVDVVMSGTFATDQARIEAWSYVYRITTANNSITLYATEKPTVSLPIQLKVVR